MESGRVSAFRTLAAVLVVLCALSSPVAAQQSQQNVQVSATVSGSTDPVAGDTTTIETTVSNLASSSDSVDITSIRVRDRDTRDIVSRVDDVSSVDPGGSVTVPLPTTFAEPGERLLTVVVYVEDATGVGVARYEQPLYVEVEAPRVRTEIDTSVPSDRFGVTDVTVSNVGNQDLTNVTLTASANGSVFDRLLLEDIDRGQNRSVSVDTRSVGRVPVTIALTYTAAGTTHTTTELVDLSEREQVLGAIELTSVETVRTATGIRIEGDAANVGGTNVESVLVRVLETQKATPTPPSGDYFVGSVDASEFATFELTASPAQNVSTLPVEVTYIVENRRVSRTQTVAIDSNPAVGASGGTAESGEPAAVTGDDEGGLPLVAIGVVLAAVVAAAGVYRWRRE